MTIQKLHCPVFMRFNGVNTHHLATIHRKHKTGGCWTMSGTVQGRILTNQCTVHLKNSHFDITYTIGLFGWDDCSDLSD